MKIAVCVKQVPDSWAEKKMAGGLLDRANVDAVLNDLDEYAVEEALRLVEAHSPTGASGEGSGHSITIISMGPDRATEAIRKALSMGADDAILVTDPALSGSDALATSLVLATVIGANDFDLILCGTESTDARMSVIPAMLAQRLGFAQLTFAGSISVVPETSQITIARMTDVGVENMKAKLPAVVSVIEKINEPRYPSFKGIMASKKKTIEVKSLSDLGIDPDTVGMSAAWSEVKDAQARPPRAAGVKVVDDGNGGNALVDFLVEKRVI
ncbi:MAG: electron transfer flavoprotein subunit beta/FixA family protein [Actinomycetes bacterium]|jgi:electron transfer flavoprotein beta subunit